MQLSILIPVYNYNIQPLVQSLLLQLKNVDCKWEILLSDDASDDGFRVQNLEFINSINNLHVKLFQQKINIGNGPNRNYLIENATYDWLLFLDADVLAVEDNFLSNYIESMQSTAQDIIAGNISYDIQNPLPHLLRWKYGKEKEQVSFNVRKKNPILNIRGANFAIKKALALKFNFPVLAENYGLIDTRFFLQFNEGQICVIENPVYHLGIEDNSVFLQKTKKAVVNALFLLNKGDKPSIQISLISKYKRVRFLKGILAKIYSKSHLNFERNLLSNNPSVFIFQLYKLLYMSYLDVYENI